MLYDKPGVYEPVKEHATPVYARCHRNTNSLSMFGNCASIGDPLVHIHTSMAMPSSTFEFVFSWYASCTLLCRLRRLVCSWINKILHSL